MFKSVLKCFGQGDITTTDIKANTLELGEYIAAAKAGDAQAQYKVAKLYEDGMLGLEEDEDVAFAWYMESAQNGYADAMYRIAEAYEDEELGQYEDEEEAIKWYIKAAMNGHKAAKKRVGDF